MNNEYVLREQDDAEIERLLLQHEVWKSTTDFGIEKADIQDTDKIIDLGSGPGYLSFDIVKLLNKEGKIFCVDNSDKFIKHIERKNLINIEAVNLDIRTSLLEHFKNVTVNRRAQYLKTSNLNDTYLD